MSGSVSFLNNFEDGNYRNTRSEDKIEWSDKNYRNIVVEVKFQHKDKNYRNTASKEKVELYRSKPKYISKSLWTYMRGASFWEDNCGNYWRRPTASAETRSEHGHFGFPKTGKCNKIFDNFKIQTRNFEITNRDLMEADGNPSGYPSPKYAGKYTRKVTFYKTSCESASNRARDSNAAEEIGTGRYSNESPRTECTERDQRTVVFAKSPPRLVLTLAKLDSCGTRVGNNFHNSNYREEWKSPGKRYELEPEMIGMRQKQIDYGKNTEEYKCYLKSVPRDKRKHDVHIFTPDKYLNCSLRDWNDQIKVWRRRLHVWDPESEDEGTENICDEQNSFRISNSQSNEYDGHLETNTAFSGWKIFANESRNFSTNTLLSIGGNFCEDASVVSTPIKGEMNAPVFIEGNAGGVSLNWNSPLRFRPDGTLWTSRTDGETEAMQPMCKSNPISQIQMVHGEDTSKYDAFPEKTNFDSRSSIQSWNRDAILCQNKYERNLEETFVDSAINYGATNILKGNGGESFIPLRFGKKGSIESRNFNIPVDEGIGCEEPFNNRRYFEHPGVSIRSGRGLHGASGQTSPMPEMDNLHEQCDRILLNGEQNEEVDNFRIQASNEADTSTEFVEIVDISNEDSEAECAEIDSREAVSFDDIFEALPLLLEVESTLQSQSNIEPPTEKKHETNPDVLKRHQKSIESTKNTKKYKAYLKAIPKDKRKGSVDIYSPPKDGKFTRTAWNRKLKLWRERLKKWFSESADKLNGDVQNAQNVAKTVSNESQKLNSKSKKSRKNRKRNRKSKNGANQATQMRQTVIKEACDKNTTSKQGENSVSCISHKISTSLNQKTASELNKKVESECEENIKLGLKPETESKRRQGQIVRTSHIKAVQNRIENRHSNYNRRSQNRRSRFRQQRRAGPKSDIGTATGMNAASFVENSTNHYNEFYHHTGLGNETYDMRNKNLSGKCGYAPIGPGWMNTSERFRQETNEYFTQMDECFRNPQIFQRHWNTYNEHFLPPQLTNGGECNNFHLPNHNEPGLNRIPKHFNEADMFQNTRSAPPTQFSNFAQEDIWLVRNLDVMEEPCTRNYYSPFRLKNEENANINVPPYLHRNPLLNTPWIPEHFSEANAHFDVGRNVPSVPTMHDPVAAPTATNNYHASGLGNYFREDIDEPAWYRTQSVPDHFSEACTFFDNGRNALPVAPGRQNSDYIQTAAANFWVPNFGNKFEGYIEGVGEFPLRGIRKESRGFRNPPRQFEYQNEHNSGIVSTTANSRVPSIGNSFKEDIENEAVAGTRKEESTTSSSNQSRQFKFINELSRPGWTCVSEPLVQTEGSFAIMDMEKPNCDLINQNTFRSSREQDSCLLSEHGINPVAEDLCSLSSHSDDEIKRSWKKYERNKQENRKKMVAY